MSSYSTSRVVACVCLVVLVNTVSSAVECVTVERRAGVVYAEASGCVVLNCSSDVGPVAWYNNNIPVPLASGRQTVTPEGDLRFNSVILSQAGWYTCVGPTTLHQHFLLIVGSPPTAINNTESYNVVSGSRVELGCVHTGSPPPTIIWRDGSDDPVVDSSSLRVDPTSNSLIIDNYTQTHVLSGGYYCQLFNDFGAVNASRTVVTITNTEVVPVYTSPLETLSTPLNPNTTTSLFCTGLNIESSNITVQWFKDYRLLPSKINDRLAQPSAGYYCCNVLYLDQQVSRHCITVWVEESLEFTSTLPIPTIISLPSTYPRPLIPCAAVERTYDTPLVSWQRDGRPLTNSTHGVNYVRVEGAGVYTCIISNSRSSNSSSVSVSLVEVCSEGADIVVGGDASNGSVWRASNNNARVDTIDNERVFVLDYSINGTNFTQSLQQLQVTSLQISARVRQTTTTPSARGLATVGLVTSQGYLSLTNPDNVSQAWQWVAMTRDFPQPVDLLSLELYVDDGGSGVAYFDNVCVSVTVLDPLPLIIGASVGGGLAFILCLALCFCLLLCILSRCKKQKQIDMMKKTSVHLNRENDGDVTMADRHYETIRRDPDYANPDNYQYIDPQDIISGPHNSGDGHYTALDPKSLDSHLYMTATPLSHRSTASLHTTLSAEEETTAAGYLQVLPSSPNDEDIYENDIRGRCTTSQTQLEHETNLYERVDL